jgi:tRNA U34 5-methylaminomethyl-2-thiouridine-forming methyltransferase MnmC
MAQGFRNLKINFVGTALVYFAGMQTSYGSWELDEQFPDWRIIPTADGSHTLASAKGLLAFHSRHGAMTESRHVFVQTGLEYWLARELNRCQPLRVLELGLGTGLNASLVLEAWRGRLSALKQGNSAGDETGLLDWSYLALETNLLNPLLLRELNYGAYVKYGAWEEWLAGYGDAYGTLDCASPFCASPKGEGTAEATREILMLRYNENQIVMSLLPQSWMQPLEGTFGMIFYDAFGPAVQPELWGEQAVALLADRLSMGGVMVTYGAQGAFRRSLMQAGLKVERLQGPPGKREMLRATQG